MNGNYESHYESYSKEKCEFFSANSLDQWIFLEIYVDLQMQVQDKLLKFLCCTNLSAFYSKKVENFRGDLIIS